MPTITKPHISKSGLNKKQSFHFRWWMAVVLIVVIAVAGIVVVRFGHASTNGNVKIYASYNLGKLQFSDGNIIGRDGGVSGMVGERPFWTFGDTFYNTSRFAVQPKEGDNYRSLTGGYGVLSNPVKITDPTLPPNTLPLQVVPYTQAELDYNRNTQNPDIVAIWPSGVIPIDQSSSYIFYTVLTAGKQKQLDYHQKGMGVARLQAGQYVASRIKDNIFGDIPMHAQFRAGSDIYFTSCQIVWIASPCKIAKVPYQQVTQAANYVWWDGKSWQP